MSDELVPNFTRENPQECFKLAKVWDARGLLKVFPEPVLPSHFSRVFNAFKDATKDRQIGDRRLPNLSEYHIDASKALPQGHQLVRIRLTRYTHVLCGSTTDRRDFYHQAQVTAERAQSKMLPCSYPHLDFQGTLAEAFSAALGSSLPRSQEVVGDGFDGRSKRSGRSKPSMPAELYPCFAFLFQGDHLGAEFALGSHSLLLENNGLLCPKSRILGGSWRVLGCLGHR